MEIIFITIIIETIKLRIAYKNILKEKKSIPTTLLLATLAVFFFFLPYTLLRAFFCQALPSLPLKTSNIYTTTILDSLFLWDLELSLPPLTSTIGVGWEELASDNTSG